MERSAADEVLKTTRDGAVVTLTIDRPRVHNALNAAVFAALDDQLARLEAGVDDVRCVIVTGSGERAFCAGADLDELRGSSAHAAQRTLARGQQVLRRLEALPLPVIAAVNGLALGGGFELALACSFIIAAETASFSLPESGLGLIPGYGGTQRLPAAIGRGAALHTMLTGTPLDAERAFALGLVCERPVPREQLDARARELAQAIAERRSPSAARAILALTGTSYDRLDHETASAALAVASDDGREGVAAFLERRPPSFAGLS